MNKKGFTLIELIAVVVIMAIIALLATPNIVNMIDKGKKEDYVADAKSFISKATYMYKQEKYRNDTNYFTSNSSKTAYTIKLKVIKDIKEQDKIDPYGHNYDLQESYITFSKSTTGSLAERKVSIFLTSNNNGEQCHLVNVDKSELDVDAIKEGIYSDGSCTTTS